jgi:integrase
MRIGRAERLTLAQARKEARKMLARVELGEDPAADKQQERKESKFTFKTVAADFLAVKKAEVRLRTFWGLEYDLNDVWRPLHAMSINGIKRRDVALTLGKIARDNGPGSARRARAALSAFYTWAMGEGIAEANPVVGTNRPAEARSRERVLDDEELRVIWNALPPYDYGRLVKLLMLTACRREEMGGLQWPEIDPGKRVIRLPKERVKNGRAHELPLSDLAWSVLQEQPRRAGRDLVFGHRGRGFTAWGSNKAQLDKTVKIAPWVLHDVRRSVATGMANIGVQPHIVEAVLNHQSGSKAGVAGVYNRSPYEKEVRQALDRWSEHVCALLERGERKVVALRAAKAGSHASWPYAAASAVESPGP